MHTECGTPYCMAPEFFIDFGNARPMIQNSTSRKAIFKYDSSVDIFPLGLVILLYLRMGMAAILFLYQVGGFVFDASFVVQVGCNFIKQHHVKV